MIFIFYSILFYNNFENEKKLICSLGKKQLKLLFQHVINWSHVHTQWCTFWYMIFDIPCLGMKEHDVVDAFGRNRSKIALIFFKIYFYLQSWSDSISRLVLRSFKFHFLPSISTGLELEIAQESLNILLCSQSLLNSFFEFHLKNHFVLQLSQ